MLIALKDVGFGYGNRSIFSGANLEINKGDKVAIVGANGAGKTTLLRVLAGQLEAREGERRVYELTRLGYFAQHAAETLDPKHTALEALDEVATNEWRPRLRSLLGQFLFSGDDVFKPCRVLSGGERQRVAIARLLLEPTNLILLDEPTHHLDLAGKDVLEDGLEQYPGAVVVVTHDRSLMARVATRVIEVNDGRVILYPGGYDDYESARMARLRSSSPGNGPQRSVADRPDDDDDVPEDDRPGIVNAGAVLAAVHHAPATRSEREAAREADKKQKAAEKKRAAAVAKLEADIEAAEARLKDVEEEMADPSTYHDGARARELVITQRTLREQIEKLWEQLGREAEAP
jgi:ATP-binding cassette subfamily F protein 3